MGSGRAQICPTALGFVAHDSTGLLGGIGVGVDQAAAAVAPRIPAAASVPRNARIALLMTTSGAPIAEN
ncbi:hypothetical protein NWFMUON74_43880 [Nocardia wallacei]|uniref:Uncharacterized protein n=1 Tax=Nocardia wallacei TaxID=480035 RepID=A0A7G1KPW5_9NOCA|nr:hypothetical protein NWFMUON74_43880 [Nocardia wallacei]